jgi:hypothetical protein
MIYGPEGSNIFSGGVVEEWLKDPRNVDVGMLAIQDIKSSELMLFTEFRPGRHSEKWKY